MMASMFMGKKAGCWASFGPNVALLIAVTVEQMKTIKYYKNTRY